MHDHIHRQIARNTIADRSRQASWNEHRRNVPDRPPPWLRKQAALAAAKAAARLDAEAARGVIAS